MRVRTFNFPGWKAFIDGKLTGINSEGGTGAILVEIPRGEHLIELTFRDTPVRHYSKLVTIYSLLFIIVLYLILKVRVHTITR